MTSTILVQQRAHSIGLLTAVSLVLGLLIHRAFLLLALALATLIPLRQVADYLYREFSHEHAP